jgi:hypothetical protein
LLPLGSEVAGIPRIEQEAKIVAVGTSAGGSENAIPFASRKVSTGYGGVVGVFQIGLVPERGFLAARGDGAVTLGQKVGQLGQGLPPQASELDRSGNERGLEGIELGIATATLEDRVALTETAVVVSQSLEVSGRGRRQGDVEPPTPFARPVADEPEIPRRKNDGRETPHVIR